MVTKLAEIIAAQEEIFVRRQPNSAHLAQAAQQHLAGGVTSSWQITAPQPVGGRATRGAAIPRDSRRLGRVRWMPTPSQLAGRGQDAFLQVVERAVGWSRPTGPGLAGFG